VPGAREAGNVGELGAVGVERRDALELAVHVPLDAAREPAVMPEIAVLLEERDVVERPVEVVRLEVPAAALDLLERHASQDRDRVVDALGRGRVERQHESDECRHQHGASGRADRRAGVTVLLSR